MSYKHSKTIKTLVFLFLALLLFSQPGLAASRKGKSKNKVPYFAGQYTISNFSRLESDKYKVQFVQIGKNKSTFYIAKNAGVGSPVLIYQSEDNKPKVKKRKGGSPGIGIATMTGRYKTYVGYPPNSQEAAVFGEAGTVTFSLSIDREAIVVQLSPDGGTPSSFTGELEAAEASTVVVKLRKTTRKAPQAGGKVSFVAMATNRGPGAIGLNQGALVISLPDEVDTSTITVKSPNLDCTTDTADPDLVGQIQCLPNSQAFNEKKYKVNVKVSFIAPEALEGTTIGIAAGFLLLDEDQEFVTSLPKGTGLVPGEFSANTSQIRIKIKGSKNKNCDGLIGKYEIRGSQGNLGAVVEFELVGGVSIRGTLLKTGDLYSSTVYEVGETVFRGYTFNSSSQRYEGERLLFCCPKTFGDQVISVIDGKLYLGFNTLTPMTCVS